MSQPAPPTSILEPAKRGRLFAILVAACLALPPLVAGPIVLNNIAADFAEPYGFANVGDAELVALLLLVVLAGTGSDRFGPKRFVLSGLGALAFGAGGCAMAPDAALFRLALGILYAGGATAFPALLVWALSQVSHRRWAMLLFPSYCIVLLMRAAVPIVQAEVAGLFGWRAVFFAGGAFVAAAFAWLLLIPDRLREDPSRAIVDVFGGGGQAARESKEAAPHGRAVAVAFGLAAILIAATIETPLAVRHWAGDLAVLLPITLGSLVAIAALGIVADRWRWLTALASVALAIGCGLSATSGSSLVYVLVFAATSVASVAYSTMLVKSMRRRVGLGAAIVVVIHVIHVLPRHVAAFFAPMTSALLAACLAAVAASIAIAVAIRSEG